MDAGDQEDQELREAIAASLEDGRNSNHVVSHGPQQVVDLTAESDDEVVPIFPKSQSLVGSETDDEAGQEKSDYDDEDLRRAIELSVQEESDVQITQSSRVDRTSEHSIPPSSKEPENPSNDQQHSTPTGILGLDRKQMEQERLARFAKRKAERSASTDERDVKHPRIDSPPKPQKISSKDVPVYDTAGKPDGSSQDISGKTQQNPQPSLSPSVQFPMGTVKKTWAFSCRRMGDDIKIEEVFQKSDLELAVLSSFMWDMEWLFSKLDTRKTRLLLMMQAKDDATKRQYEAETASLPNLRLCFPPMEAQVNCMHSKLMLLFHPQYLRIVVPTANLVPYDWGEMGGVMENSVFLIDLPKKKESASHTVATAFFEELAYFLKASALNENIISKLNLFDFSSTSHIAFVHTIGGSHTGDAWKRTGYCGLGRSVNNLGLQVSKPLNLDFVTSSLGSLTDEFLRSLYLAAQGDDGTTEYTLRTAKSFPARSRTDPNRLIQKNTAAEWKDNRFRAYFPSQMTVDASKGGPNCAGTICFQSKWYSNPKFPRHILRDSVSERGNVLMHSKILYVRPDEPIPLPNNKQCQAWAYVGSANLSESAWGRLVQDRATKEPKLNCRNWECGVLIPVINDSTSAPAESRSPAQEGKSQPGYSPQESATHLDMFRNVVPVPMRLPGARYEPDRRPWYYMETDLT
ncbi:uncharacterized protein BDW47DRAFT_75683 [Aspergillus candidus]|uniref:Phospholipase D/nuclease n=1 Tax=Aspergillus candidus TaxID=41067 RepID=A0A2I2FKJ1_ASPCN|nr:phospholipase D/nuclease [Aspergillus candidus]PLB41146.1 phospholipase D/nuclease [Aspergillus candidus]